MERFKRVYGQGNQKWNSARYPKDLPPGWIFPPTDRKEMHEKMLADINDLVCYLTVFRIHFCV